MALLPLGDGCELYCEPQLSATGNGDLVFSLTDYSGKNRHLTAADSQPQYYTGILNSKSVVRFSGANNPLSNPANFTLSCGWIVSKFNASVFPHFNGLLCGLNSTSVLVGLIGTNEWFNFAVPKYEYRLGGRIYLAASALAPMNLFQIVFFRFWNPIIMDGVQLGQHFGLTDRRWNGDVALVGLYSRNFHEEEIHNYTKSIAENFNLSLPSVYPYQSDIKGAKEEPEHSVNFYDPPEGDRISESLSASKKSLELNFSGADEMEIDYFLSFYNSHYEQSLPFIYRDYRFTPPRDIEGYFDSPYEINGENNDFAYGFKMRQK
jgi:hypothetical protein